MSGISGGGLPPSYGSNPHEPQQGSPVDKNKLDKFRRNFKKKEKRLKKLNDEKTSIERELTNIVLEVLGEKSSSISLSQKDKVKKFLKRENLTGRDWKITKLGQKNTKLKREITKLQNEISELKNSIQGGVYAPIALPTEQQNPAQSSNYAPIRRTVQQPNPTQRRGYAPIGVTSEQPSTDLASAYAPIAPRIDQQQEGVNPPIQPSGSWVSAQPPPDTIDILAGVERVEVQSYGEIIGEGNFGIVRSGKLANGTDVAIKSLRESASEEEVKAFQREAKRHFEIPPHDNVVRCFGVVEEVNGAISMITEWCDGGDVANFIEKNSLSNDQKYKLMRDVAAGLKHLKANGVIHRDLAARNVLIVKNPDRNKKSSDKDYYQAKISDFGLSRAKEEERVSGTQAELTYQSHANTGPIKWMAPEALKHGESSPASDVWSFGVMCLEIYTNREPHPQYKTGQQVTNLGSEVAEGRIRPQLQGTIIEKRVNRCFEYEPKDRPPIEDLFRFLDTFL